MKEEWNCILSFHFYRTSLYSKMAFPTFFSVKVSFVNVDICSLASFFFTKSEVELMLDPTFFFLSYSFRTLESLGFTEEAWVDQEREPLLPFLSQKNPPELESCSHFLTWFFWPISHRTVALSKAHVKNGIASPEEVFCLFVFCFVWFFGCTVRLVGS